MPPVMQQFIRITPAWAGKRISYYPRYYRDVDHPRVGGEKAITSKMENLSTGSPPRGRGKDRVCSHGNGQSRITPAWAGKS